MFTYQNMEKSSFLKTWLKESPKYTGMEKGFSKPSEVESETQESELEMPLLSCSEWDRERGWKESSMKWVEEHRGQRETRNRWMVGIHVAALNPLDCLLLSFVCVCARMGHLVWRSEDNYAMEDSSPTTTYLGNPTRSSGLTPLFISLALLLAL